MAGGGETVRAQAAIATIRIRDLCNAAAAGALRKIGFNVIEGRDLPKRAMEGKIIEFSRKLYRAGLPLFFYAGHGMQVGARNHLLPIDAGTSGRSLV